MDPNPTWPLPHPSPAPAPALAWTIVPQSPAQDGVPYPAVSHPPTPRDGICWQVQQLYGGTRVPGRFLLQGEAGAAAGGPGLEGGG